MTTEQEIKVLEQRGKELARLNRLRDRVARMELEVDRGVGEWREALDHIGIVVCEHYHVLPIQLKLRTKVQFLMEPRHVVRYFAREMTGLSYEQLSRIFRCKHHGSIMNSIAWVQNRAEQSERFADTLNKLRQECGKRIYKSERRERIAV